MEIPESFSGKKNIWHDFVLKPFLRNGPEGAA